MLEEYVSAGGSDRSKALARMSSRCWPSTSGGITMKWPQARRRRWRQRSGLARADSTVLRPRASTSAERIGSRSSTSHDDSSTTRSKDAAALKRLRHVARRRGRLHAVGVDHRRRAVSIHRSTSTKVPGDGFPSTADSSPGRPSRSDGTLPVSGKTQSAPVFCTTVPFMPCSNERRASSRWLQCAGTGGITLSTRVFPFRHECFLFGG